MNVDVAIFFKQIDNIIQNHVYSNGEKAFAITSKWYNAFAMAAKTKDNNFSKKIINNITDSNGRIDPVLMPKYDYVIVPQKAWNEIKNIFQFTKEVEIPVFYNSELSKYVPCIHPKEISIYYCQTYAILIFSEENTIKEVLDQSKKYFNINNDNYHLYNYSLKNFSNLLSNEHQKLKDLTPNYTIDILLSEIPYQILPEVNSRGICGLENVGQTCYINAIIQCLSHCQLIRDYFLSNDIIKFMNGRKENVKLTQEFIKILRMMRNNQNSFIPMKEFKESLGLAKHGFATTFQQDAGEFFTSFLSLISNAIMRPKDERRLIDDEELPDEAKKVIEDEIDNSFLGDVFYGLLNNKTTCPNCNNVTDNFDSFLLLPLRLPSSESKMEIIFYSEGMKKKEIYYIQKQAGNAFTAEYILNELKTNYNFPNLSRIQLVGKNTISGHYQLINESITPVILNNEDTIYIFDASNINLRYMLTFVEIPELDPILVFYDPAQVLENSYNRPPEFDESIKKQIKAILGVQYISIKSVTKLYSTILDIRAFISDSDKDLSHFKHKEMALTLENCLKLSSTAVLLDDDNFWCCPKCQMRVHATRNTFIYRSPKILAFQFTRWNYLPRLAKDNREVIFPDTIELSKFMISNKKERNYELFGVVNHGGSMSSGHYTAGVKIDGKAYLFNDKIVTECQLSDLHSPNAYILFYKLID